VVCSVNVLHHSTAISPALRAGKNVYVEWPLGKNLQDAQALLDLKNKHNVKIANVGLQARQAPIISKAKALIAEGKIGKVLSSTWNGYGLQGGKSIPEGMAYFTEAKVGGNFWTIHFGHALDYVQSGMFGPS
jgi:predicted dehydrogenase